MSRETTFVRDLHVLHDKTELSAIFTRLCHRVAEDLQRKGYAGRTVGIKLRYANFKIVTREISGHAFTQDAAVIRQIAGQCLKRVSLDQNIRLLGVRVGNLVHWDAQSQQAQGDVLAHTRKSASRGDPFSLSLFD